MFLIHIVAVMKQKLAPYGFRAVAGQIFLVTGGRLKTLCKIAEDF